MNNDSGATTSLWMATQEVSGPGPLKEDAQADVCVVGAGLAGLSAAYLLAKEGHSAVVLEDGPVGGGATGRTTAHLSTHLDDGYREYERVHGKEGARTAANAASAALDRIERNIQEEGIDCDFARLDAFLWTPPSQSDEALDRELEACHRAGLTNVERLARVPIDFFDSGKCLRIPRQGQFHPLRYLAGLEKALARHGGRLYTGTHAKGIEDGAVCEVGTADGPRVSAGAVIVATNVPINDRIAIHSKQAPYRTYAFAARIPENSVPSALYWDTDHPYHYARVHTERRNGENRDFLIVGGEDHRTGQDREYGERFQRLEEWARRHFPVIQAVEYRWSGQVMEPIDGLGWLGRNPGNENVYVISGDSGDGMIHGTIGAMLCTDLITKRANPWEKLFDPGRVPAGALGRFAGMQLDVVSKYVDYVTPGEIESPEALAPGEGAILRRGLKKLAVYRDERGVIHERSAVCPHMQCIVSWNPVEKSWDCPCHGSRFDAYGRVYNGPANTDLPEA